MPTAPVEWGSLSAYVGGGNIEIGEPYLVVMQHSVTTEYEDISNQIMETLTAVFDIDMPIICLSPNIDPGADKIEHHIRTKSAAMASAPMLYLNNLPPEEYLRFIRYCSCLVGNSSSGLREGGYLGIPVVNIGSRQIHREHGPNVLSVPPQSKAILEAIRMQIDHGLYSPSTIYGIGGSGEKIADILAMVALTHEKPLSYVR